jgi:hypothetical protein
MFLSFVKKNIKHNMSHSITFDDTTVSLNTGTIQTRKVKDPALVCKRLKLMGIESLKPFQARRMFDHGTCEEKDISLTCDETSVTIDTPIGDFTRIVKCPKFVCDRLKALGIEDFTTQKAKRIFDRGCSFYDTRDKLSLVLQEGQRIRHRIKKQDSIREAVFKGGVLLWEDIPFLSLSSFVSGHYKAAHPTRLTSNAWVSCETLVDGNWVNLRDHYFHG